MVLCVFYGILKSKELIIIHQIISCCTNGNSNSCSKPKKYVYTFDVNTTYCNDTFMIFGDCVADESDLPPPKYNINQTVKCYTINKNCDSFSTNKNKKIKEH